MRRCAWIVGLGLMLAAHARAHAQAELPLELVWESPAECGSADEVRAELQRIARVKPGYALPPLTARVRVERHGAGLEARLTTEHEGMSGERRLEAADCPTLVGSLTLVLALAFGKGVEVAEPSAGTTPSADAPSEPAPRTEPASPAPPTTPARSTQSGTPSTTAAAAGEAASSEHDDAGDAELRTLLFLGAGVHFALLPEPAGSGVLGVEVASGAWSVSLRAAAWPGSSTSVVPAVSARFDGLGGALQGCGQLPLVSAELALCGGALAAALRGRSHGAFDDGSDTARWLALTATTAASWPAHSLLRVRLEATLAASLSRPRFVIAGLGPVHRVPLFAPQLSALLVVAP